MTWSVAGWVCAGIVGAVAAFLLFVVIGLSFGLWGISWEDLT